MEKEQIIKALELHSVIKPCLDECPYNKRIHCGVDMAKDALALIKELTQTHEMLSESYDHLEKTKDELLSERSRLTEENERLSTALANYDRKTEVRIAEEYYTAEAYDELREENERLRADKSYWKNRAESAELEHDKAVKKGYSYGKADTVREMQERLKYTLCINNEENTEFFDYSYTLETIDEVANEMLNKNTEE
jgi:phenylalanyl-tRNA synthetase alpha subunit